MRVYELIFIVKPDIPDDEVEKAVEQIRTAITDGGGSIDKVDAWGKRRMAYEVRGYLEGYYVLIQYSVEGNQDLPKEIERRLRVAEPVIKFLTVRIDEDLQRIAKIRAKRDKRAGRKPQAAAATSRPAPGAPKDSGDSGGDGAKEEEKAS